MNVPLIAGLCSVVLVGCAEAEELSPNAFPHFDGGPFTTVTTGTTTTSTTSTGTTSTVTGPSTTATSTGGSTGSAGGSGGSTASSTGGSGGAGGTTGTGGTGGTGGTMPMSDAGFIAGLQVLYTNMQTAPSSPYVGCELHAKNGGQSSVAVGELKLRYYFTNEPMLPPQITMNWSHVTTPGSQLTLTVTSAVTGVSPVVGGADTYIEFSLSSAGHANLAPLESADFSWQMQGPNPAANKYTQTNDYSWDATKTSLQPWEHVVLLRNGTVVWGAPP